MLAHHILDLIQPYLNPSTSLRTLLLLTESHKSQTTRDQFFSFLSCHSSSIDEWSDTATVALRSNKTMTAAASPSGGHGRQQLKPPLTTGDEA